MRDWTWWLAATLLLASVEALTGDLFFLMLAVGALAAALAAALGAPLLAQLLVLAVVSTLLVALVRPFALRVMRRGRATLTGVDLLPGSQAVVLERVDAHDGRVKVRGEVWSARSSGDAVHEEGTTVTVVKVDGATVVVR